MGALIMEAISVIAVVCLTGCLIGFWLVRRAIQHCKIVCLHGEDISAGKFVEPVPAPDPTLQSGKVVTIPSMDRGARARPVKVFHRTQFGE